MSLLGLIGHIRVSGFFLGSDRQVKPEAEDFELRIDDSFISDSHPDKLLLKGCHEVVRHPVLHCQLTDGNLRRFALTPPEVGGDHHAAARQGLRHCEGCLPWPKSTTLVAHRKQHMRRLVEVFGHYKGV